MSTTLTIHNAGCDHARLHKPDEEGQPLTIIASGYPLCKNCSEDKERSIREYCDKAIDRTVESAAKIMSDAIGIWSSYRLDGPLPEELHGMMDTMGMVLKNTTAALERERDEQLKKLRAEHGYGEING